MVFKLIEFRNSERPLWRLWWNGEGQSYADGDCPERKIGNAETPRWYDSRFSTPPPPPLSLFLAVDRPPWYKFISLPSLPLPLKSKMAVIIFVTEHSLAKIRPALQAKNGEEMIAANIEDSDKVKAEIRGAVLAIEEKLKWDPVAAPPSTSQPLLIPLPKSEKAKAPLPNLEVKKFSGRIHEWQEFWDW